MSDPVPGHEVRTRFHKRGPKWKACGAKVAADGTRTALHTGVDIPAPKGTTVVAARAGVTAHVSFGASFGSHQLAVLCDDGTEDFYAHMSARVPAGRRVDAGDKVGEVGAESSAQIGPHLHFERHKKHADHWSCDIIVDPEPSLDAGGAGGPTAGKQVLLSKLRFGQRDSDSVRRLQRALNQHRRPEDPPALPITGNYLTKTDAAVRLCQQRHGFGNDPAKKSNVGPLQAKHLFGSSKGIVDDR